MSIRHTKKLRLIPVVFATFLFLLFFSFGQSAYGELTCNPTTPSVPCDYYGSITNATTTMNSYVKTNDSWNSVLFYNSSKTNTIQNEIGGYWTFRSVNTTTDFGAIFRSYNLPDGQEFDEVSLETNKITSWIRSLDDSRFLTFNASLSNGLILLTGTYEIAGSSTPATLEFIQQNSLGQNVWSQSIVVSEEISDSFNFSLPIPIQTSTTTISQDYTISGYISQSIDFLHSNLLDATSTIISTTASTTAELNADLARAMNELASSTAYTTCGLTAIGGCIQNAGVWLMYPSQASIDRFNSLQFNNTFPFAYGYDVGNIWHELLSQNASTTEGVGVDIPWFNHSTNHLTFINAAMITAVPFTPFIKTFITAVLWLMFSLLCWYQIRNLYHHSPK